ncbi:hypothetical protein EUX98_g6394 [Antrodiella citrinella]|uniref:F-box domain-containing protein n=1 Tax=Antrodiella citrinella TaxID=2447956 RepID=A0A4S4MQZ3_9APHY|nr:hypothetical protein EUX98_g6394 [Antrodiella citrinella]
MATSHFTHRKGWGDLDLIALDRIFELTLPRPGLLSPSYASNSPWCKYIRMTKGLTVVCKHWRDAALSSLYGTIVLSRISQVFAFAETLRSCNADYPSFVHSLQIMCTVPGFARERYTDCVAEILERCPRLTSLTIGPTFTHAARGYEKFRAAYDDALCAVIMQFGHRLTKVEIRDDVRYQQPIYPPNFFQSFPNLISLSIPHIPNAFMPQETESLSSYPALSLDTLEEVTIDLRTVSANFSAWEDWHLPRLTRVRFREGAGTQDNKDGLLAFFKAHGPVIKELDLRVKHYVYPNSWSEELLNDIVALCPVLTYIVCEQYVWEWLEGRQFSSALHVDMWVVDVLDQWCTPRAMLLHRDPHALPHIRMLDDSLKYFHDFTGAFPPPTTSRTGKPWPTVNTEFLVTLHDFFGIVIVDMGFCVLGVDSYEEALILSRHDSGERVQDGS